MEDFTEAEIEYLDGRIANMEKVLEENSYELPPFDEIVFIKTTMHEESDASGYTHGTQIYLGSMVISTAVLMSDVPMMNEQVDELLCHELFHCLTRCNPDFRWKCILSSILRSQVQISRCHPVCSSIT